MRAAAPAIAPAFPLHAAVIDTSQHAESLTEARVLTLSASQRGPWLHFLAEVSAAFPGRDGNAYRASFLRGVDYLLNAQFPNGGWPQISPLEGGYHDAIAFNDDAVTGSAELLTNVADASVRNDPPCKH